MAAAGYGLYYQGATAPARAMLSRPEGELEWLRQEFHLSDAQVANVKALHAAYVPKCDEMCRKIMEANAQLDELVSKGNRLSPEIAAAFDRAMAVQANCRKQMLAHIYEVSAQMDPAEGRRYFELMKRRVIQPGLSSDTAVRRSPK
jgi:outer membrane murein-binding lipoprotein Lpp